MSGCRRTRYHHLDRRSRPAQLLHSWDLPCRKPLFDYERTENWEQIKAAEEKITRDQTEISTYEGVRSSPQAPGMLKSWLSQTQERQVIAIQDRYCCYDAVATAMARYALNDPVKGPLAAYSSFMAAEWAVMRAAFAYGNPDATGQGTARIASP